MTSLLAALRSKTEKKRKKKKKRRRRLHLSAAQQLVVSQEADGHFDARTVGFRLARIWEKLVPAAPMPPGDETSHGDKTSHRTLYSAPAVSELSTDPADATVFVVRLFEIYAEKSGCGSDSEKREQLIAWFGSGTGSIYTDTWLAKAEGWLVLERVDWRSSRSAVVAKVVEKWFDTKANCKHRGTFIDSKRLMAQQVALAKKFSASHKESLRRGEAWLRCTPANIKCVAWEKATAIGWCLGGEGGAYLVRIGTEKLLVKGCTDVGDVVADEFAKMVGVRSAPVRFVAQTSPEYDDVQRALGAAEPDEPEVAQRLEGALGQMKQTGHPLLVMGFVAGESIAGRQGSHLLRHSGAAANGGQMRALGRAIALDCVMNNWDRFPALPMWPPTGNLGNVLVTQRQADGTCDVVCIDQTAMLLAEAKDRRAYFDALREFVEEVATAHRSLARAGKLVAVGGIERIKRAVRSQVPLWTGDKGKDAAMYDRFVVSPDSVPGVELGDGACGFLLEGLWGVFARAGTLRTQFAAKRAKLSALCHTLFGSADAKISARVEACLDFVYDCLGVAASAALGAHAPVTPSVAASAAEAAAGSRRDNDKHGNESECS